jgi:mono/diheme cytochrome c family protein
MKSRVLRACAFVIVGLGLSVAFVAAQGTGQGPSTGGGGRSGWTIPAEAADAKNPLPASDAVLAGGKKLYAAKCQRCHGAEGKGNGVDADPARQKDMNLTLAANAARNPDGVVFYKIWNGRSSPRMPKFSEELTKDQVWAIVTYVQTLRARP